MSRRRLLVLDVEGTIFSAQIRLPGTTLDSTIWQAIASALGEDAVKEEVETHQKWERGDYPTYIAWMRATIEIHRRYELEERTFNDLISRAEYLPGAVQTLRSIDRERFIPLLVSGGFRELARRAQLDCDIDHAFAACEYIFDTAGQLAAWNLLPCDFVGKIDFVRLLLAEYRLDAVDWVFVGDGRNDMSVAEAAPISIGMRPHPELAAKVTHAVDNFADLWGVLDQLPS